MPINTLIGTDFAERGTKERDWVPVRSYYKYSIHDRFKSKLIDEIIQQRRGDYLLHEIIEQKHKSYLVNQSFSM